MNAQIHRWLMFIGALGSGAGGVLATPGVDLLGIPSVVGSICVFVAAGFIMAATAWRANFPDTP